MNKEEVKLIIVNALKIAIMEHERFDKVMHMHPNVRADLNEQNRRVKEVMEDIVTGRITISEP